MDIISWIDRELDEESREDFFRLKKVTDNKKKKKIETQAEADKGRHNEEESKEEYVLPQVDFGQESDEEDIFVWVIHTHYLYLSVYKNIVFAK